MVRLTFTLPPEAIQPGRAIARSEDRQGIRYKSLTACGIEEWYRYGDSNPGYSLPQNQISTRCDFTACQPRHSLSLRLKAAKSSALPVAGALGPSTMAIHPGKRIVRLSPGFRVSVVPNRAGDPRNTVPESPCSRPC